jgi:Uma2 family endonuclease
MGTTTALMTVDQFRTLEEPPHAYFELRHGEVCEVTRPRFKHIEIQDSLRERLSRAAGNGGKVYTELPFRPLPEHELWVADVAYLPAQRVEQARIDQDVQGSPDLVIEVLSPSNTKREIRSRAAFCLSTGSLEFWVVDPVERTVTVFTTGDVQVYSTGHAVPVDRFFSGQPAIPVNDIFAA